MTDRQLVRQLVSQARRTRVVELIADGVFDCDRCGTPIFQPKPRQRFCSEHCRKRHNDQHGAVVAA